MGIFQFPVSNISVCYNDTDCGIGGKCSIIAPIGSNQSRCECPYLYNPLDKCQTFYYDIVGTGLYIGYLVMILVCHIILVGLIYRQFSSEVRYLFKNCKSGGKCRVPRLMFVMTSSIVLLSLNSLIVAILYLAQLSIASLVNSIGTALFALCYDIVLYFCFVLMIKSKNLGNLEFKWKVISKLIIITGCIGLAISFTAGIVRELDRSLYNTVGWAITLGIVLGVVIPTLLAGPVLIYSVRWISKHEQKTERSMLILWRCTWIVLAAMTFMILSFISLLYTNIAFPLQLPDVITMSRFVISIEIIIAEAIFVAFVLNTHPKKLNVNKSEKLTPSSERTTPSTSHLTSVNTTSEDNAKK